MGVSVNIAVNGACGRMGRRVIELVGEDEQLALVAALEHPEHPDQGKDVGEVLRMGAVGVRLTSELDAGSDVVIDFSLPPSTVRLVPRCATLGVPVVVATTGLSDDQRAMVEGCARTIAVLLSPNMSRGVNVLFRLVSEAARLLGQDYDVEIVETHHRFKKDAPSGTALRLAENVRSVRPDLHLVHGREGAVGPRAEDELGIHAVRSGDVVGEHTVSFTALGETVELRHRAHTRDCFARGAVAGAKFLVSQPPGLYTTADVLGLR